MTLDKAIQYLDIVLNDHPHLRPADFGQAVKLGQEALKRIKESRTPESINPHLPIPGEDTP